jgi:hypothetical protein
MPHATDGVSGETGDRPAGIAALLLGALRFDPRAFASAARERQGRVAGTAAVLLGGIARGVGAFPQEGWQGVAMGLAVGVAVWLGAGLAIWCAGFALNRRAPRFGSLLASLGLAAAPFALLALMAFAPLARAVFLIAHGWATLASIVAVREVERVSTSRAALICVAALCAGIVVLMAIGSAADGATPPWNRPCVSLF